MHAFGPVTSGSSSQAPGTGLGSASTQPFFPAGTVMYLKDLTARPELNGAGVTFGPPKEGDNSERVPVIVNTTGERIG
eukprot:6326261-Karenia_brevis.AAC.1